MTKKERKVLGDLAAALTRCQVLKGAETRNYAIVNGAHALWSMLSGNEKNVKDDINYLNSLIGR